MKTIDSLNLKDENYVKLAKYLQNNPDAIKTILISDHHRDNSVSNTIGCAIFLIFLFFTGIFWDELCAIF